MSSFRGLVEVIERHGLFMELYTDRGSHYFFTPEAGGKVSKTQLTQVGRALKQLGIGHMPAYSPEARGRCERAFRTLQDRLPKELALAGVTTVEAANRFLREAYLPEHNARLRRACRGAGGGLRRKSPRRSGATSSASRRSAGSATTTASRWRGRSLQIPPTPLRPHLVRATVPGPRLSRRHAWPSSRGRSGWPASRRRRRRAPRTWPRDHRDAASPVDLMDNATRCPQPHRARNSGQLMRYLLRTKQRARYRCRHGFDRLCATSAGSPIRLHIREPASGSPALWALCSTPRTANRCRLARHERAAARRARAGSPNVSLRVLGSGGPAACDHRPEYQGVGMAFTALARPEPDPQWPQQACRSPARVPRCRHRFPPALRERNWIRNPSAHSRARFRLASALSAFAQPLPLHRPPPAPRVDRTPPCRGRRIPTVAWTIQRNP